MSPCAAHQIVLHPAIRVPQSSFFFFTLRKQGTLYSASQSVASSRICDGACAPCASRACGAPTTQRFESPCA